MKPVKKEENKMDMKMAVMLLIYIGMSVGGLVVFKLGSQKDLKIGFSGGSLQMNASIYVFLGLLLYVCSFLLYMFIISQFDLSYIAPISMGLAQIATVVSAVLVFKDKLNIYQVVGIVLIILGVALINVKRGA